MERNSSGPAVYRLEHSDLPLDTGLQSLLATA